MTKPRGRAAGRVPARVPGDGSGGQRGGRGFGRTYSGRFVALINLDPLEGIEKMGVYRVLWLSGVNQPATLAAVDDTLLRSIPTLIGTSLHLT